MKRLNGFTLIEILIALTVSSFVMVLIVQSLRQTFRFISEGQKIITVDRSVCLFLNQLERDLSSAFIPKPYKKIDVDNKEGAKAKKLERSELFFIATTKEETAPVWFKTKRKLLDKINFVTTYPLQSYGRQKIRPIRVMYELVLNKKASEGERLSYDLWRKETAMLDNVDFKEPEIILKKKGKEFIWSHLVTQNIKELSFEFIVKMKDEENQKERKEKRIIKSFSWGENKETQNLLPDFMRYHIIFWDEAKVREYSFDGILPTLSEMKKGKEEEKAPTQSTKPEEQKIPPVTTESKKSVTRPVSLQILASKK